MFSVVTPNLNMLSYLKLCHASIADQGIKHEHVVIDGGSKDGSIDWLKSNPNVIYHTGNDHGMYDALNKGIKKCKYDIVSYLNSDEQYLPETFAAVEKVFTLYPEVDIVFGDKLNIFPDGSLNSFKKSIRMNKHYVLASNLYIPSCATFFRRKVFDNEESFNKDFKSCGDAELFIRLKEHKYSFHHIRKYLGTFTIRETNLSQSLDSKTERAKLVAMYNNIPGGLLYLVLGIKQVEKLISGVFTERFPLEYQIFLSCLDKRTTIIESSGTYKTTWVNNLRS